MTFKPARLLLALLAVVALPVFAQNIAVVNGKPIPSSRADAMYKQVVAQNPQADSPRLHEDIKQALIRQEVVMQEAEKQGFSKSDAVKEQLAEARQSIISRALIIDYFKKNPITDAEIQAEYDADKLQAGDKEYHIRHILTENEADALAIIAKLKAGAKFEDLAKTSKDAGTAANGGDLDWMLPSSLPAEAASFRDAIVSLQKGQVTEKPAHTPAGFHVIKLDDTRAFAIPPLEKVKQQIGESVQQKRIKAFQDALVKKAVITAK